MDGKKFLFWAALAGGGIWLLTRSNRGTLSNADISLRVGAALPPWTLSIGNTYLIYADAINNSTKDGSPVEARLLIEMSAITNTARNLVSVATIDQLFPAGGLVSTVYNISPPVGSSGEFGTIVARLRNPDTDLVIAEATGDFRIESTIVIDAQIALRAGW